MLWDRTADEGEWSSQGLAPRYALEVWQRWASDALAPMQIAVPDSRRFQARRRSRTVGPLRVVELEATAQRVAHTGGAGHSGDEGAFQLCLCTDTPIATRMGGRAFQLEPGHFVLIDNSESYQMDMDGLHACIDVIMPAQWLERWLPSSFCCTGRPYSASSRWGAPLGAYLSTLASEIDHAVLPRSVMADQVGALMALAVGYRPSGLGRHKDKLIQRLMQILDERYSDPDLDPQQVADAMGISKRYVHGLLAEAGTTFLNSLRKVRLDRASELLADPRLSKMRIAEVSFRCGYLDSSYFARIFRRRFGLDPNMWRAQRRQ
jgi:AraC-like DNA-binding protein